MTITSTLLIANVVGVIGMASGVQPRPNFAGQWQTSAPAASSPLPDPAKTGGTSRAAAAFTISQDGKTLTIERNAVTGGLKTTYALDGSETTDHVKNSGKLLPIRTRAEWQGSRLVIVGTTTHRGKPFELRRTFSLDENGALVIDMTLTANGQTVRSTTRYRKQHDTIT
jgi:hypothetical protein